MRLSCRFALILATGMLADVGTTRAQELMPTKQIRVAVSTSGRRLVKYRVVSAVNSLTGDPTVGGATMHVQLTPGGPQCFQLPAANWRQVGPNSWRYRDLPMANPSIRARFKHRVPQKFTLHVVVRGTSIAIAPGNPTTDYDVTIRIAQFGIEYCGSLVSATPHVNNAMLYDVVNDGVPASCQLAACSPSGAFLTRAGLF